MFADGYSIFVLLLFDVTALNNVNVPTFPANIKDIKINFPLIFKPCVIPVDAPTVANADTVSNSKSETGISGTESTNKNNPIKSIPIE